MAATTKNILKLNFSNLSDPNLRKIRAFLQNKPNFTQFQRQLKNNVFGLIMGLFGVKAKSSFQKQKKSENILLQSFVIILKNRLIPAKTANFYRHNYVKASVELPEIKIRTRFLGFCRR